MELLHFLTTIILISLSGALAPGPLSVAALSSGIRGGYRAGLLCSLGHMIVELPLVLLLGVGLLSLMSIALVRGVIGALGGLVLMGSSALLLRDAKRVWRGKMGLDPPHGKGPLLLGVAMTGLNPYFLLWWPTVGSALILQGLLLASIQGLLIMYAAHIWIDFAWLGLLAHLAHKGKEALGLRAQPYALLLASFSLILAYFGLDFLRLAVRELS